MTRVVRRVRDLVSTSARVRVTLVLAGVLVATGASILGTVVVVMRLLPVAAFAPDGSWDGVGQLVPGGAVDPFPQDDGYAPVAPAAPDAPELPDGVAPDALEGVAVQLIRLNTVDEVLGQLLATSVVVFVVVVALGTWASWLVAGRLLRPVARLTAAAAEIDHGSLQPRLDLGGRRDEFGRLAETMHDMLVRLDASYQAQRRFAANASHELRTPLAMTQAMLDVALAEPDEVDVRLLATRLREVTARSVGTVGALLTLADAQSGDRDAGPVELAALVAAATSSTAATARERGLRVTTELDPVVVTGDEVLLGVLVDNLVANAVRHSTAGGRVHVALRGATLVVENDGEPLDPGAVASFTEPFWRGAGRVAGSHGLGLALVAAVARAHGAELDLRPREGGGLLVTVVFVEQHGEGQDDPGLGASGS